MSTILRSDLFRNFLGGFVIGAVALVMLQPDDSLATAQGAAPATAVTSASTTSL